jgi:signal transduction histidine kinase
LKKDGKNLEFIEPLISKQNAAMIFNESFIQSFLHRSGDALLIFSTNDYKILQANNKAKTFLQWNDEVTQPYFLTDFLSQTDCFRWQKHLATLDESDDEVAFIAQFALKTDSFTDVKLKLMRLPKERWLCFMQKNISDVLTFGIGFYETIIEKLPFEFIVFDKEWRYQYINPKIFKDPQLRNWMIGKTDFDYCEYKKLNPVLAQRRWEHYRRCVEEKKTIDWIDTHVKSDGVVTYMMRIMKPYFADGVFQFLFGFGVDVTQVIESQRELKVAMEDLQKNNEELREYAFITVHDLKEPLRNVVSFSNLLSRRYKTQLDKSGQEFLHFVASNAERMNSLLNELSAYINIEKRERMLEYASLPKLIQTAVAALNHRIAENNAMIHYDKDDLRIHCYPSYMEQLFQSLFENALKFRKKEVCPEIHVRLLENEVEWTILVMDNGIGIAPAYQKKIFSIFTRLDKVNYEGSGMGLSVCRKIVQLHRGKIGVESDGASGSTFYFTLLKPENETHLTLQNLTEKSTHQLIA